jgi:hypothetical protein
MKNIMNYKTNNINYQIDIGKHPMLKNINSDYLPHILDEIFGIGYNLWVKNFIRNDIILNDTQNSITENKQSSNKGQSGESIVIDIIKDKFQDIQIENTSKIPHSGDIQIVLTNKKKIIVEVKNYNNTINQDQIDKLKFDMKFSGINYAIFISLNSGIVGRKRFEIETFYFEKSNYYIIYIPYSMHKNIPSRKYMISHNSIEDSTYNLTLKLEFSICIIQSISDSIIKFNNNIILTNDFDYLIHEFNNFYDDFRNVKSSSLKLEENIKKNLDSHLSVIKEYELNIKNNINKLIDKKLKNYAATKKYQEFNENNLILISDNNWNIFINNQIVGKIILFDKKYDLVISNSKYYIHEIFDSIQQCINFIQNI